MSSTSSVRIDDLGDEEVRRLAERLSRMNISMTGNDTSSSLEPRHTVSCISFLRSFLGSSRRHTPRPPNAAQSDFGVDYVLDRDHPRQAVGSVANQHLAHEGSLLHDQVTVVDDIHENESNHQPFPPHTPLPGISGEKGLGNLPEVDSSLNNWSEKELQKMYDDAIKRSDKAPLPPGGVYCGRKDQRSVLTFIQECERTPAWDIGYGPSPAFFQGAYLERCLGKDIREIIVNIVDKQMKEGGYRGYRKAMHRASYIRKELIDRFLSVDSRRLLIDRWEHIVWDTKEETFETFYLRFDYIRMAIDAQRGFPLTREDIADRLFASFADDICENILHKFGNSPTLEELIEYGRRHSTVLLRRASKRQGRSTVNAIESQALDYDDDDGVAAAMPVATTTTDATTNTDRLFLTNLSYTATESDLLSAFRSILKVAGVRPISLKVFRDSSSGKSRGIGLIQFENAPEAQKALQLVNGKAVLGRRVYARRDRGFNADGGDRKRRRVEQSQSSTQQTPDIVRQVNPPAVAESQPHSDTSANVVSSAEDRDAPPADEVIKSSAVNCVEGGLAAEDLSYLSLR